MKDDKRRKALKALAIGAPAMWTKPVVDSVVLPAHANGSLRCPTGSDCEALELASCFSGPVTEEASRACYNNLGFIYPPDDDTCDFANC